MRNVKVFVGNSRVRTTNTAFVLMNYLNILLLTAIAYLFGAIPIGWLVVKVLTGLTVCDHGDGTATWLNIYRTLSKRMGISIFVLEIIKGSLAPALAYVGHEYYGWFEEVASYPLMFSFGLAAIAGQHFSLFLQPTQNRGVTAALGVLLALHPWVSLMCIGIAGLIYAISKYEHLGYVVGIFCFPFLWLAFGHVNVPIITVSIFAGILALATAITHKDEMTDWVQQMTPLMPKLPKIMKRRKKW